VKKAMGAYPRFGESDIPYAVKVYNKQMLKGMKYAKLTKLSDLLEKSEEEIVLAGKFDHPNISKTFICFNEGDDRSGTLFTLM
jgi:hypothetical protein